MKYKTKVYIPRLSVRYVELFQSRGFDVVHSLSEDVGLIQFIGGADVNPDLYNAKKHPATSFATNTDASDVELYNYGMQYGIPMVGVCRGGQFLNVMCGGTMWQHVEGHTRSHRAFDVYSGECIRVTSTHHQMMRMGQSGVLLLAATEGKAKEEVDDDGVIHIHTAGATPGIDVEAVAYPDQECLCFQPHPEFEPTSRMASLYFEYIEQWLLIKTPSATVIKAQ